VERRSLIVWLAAIGCLLLGVLLGFGLVGSWQYGALWSGICALIIIVVLFAGLMIKSDNWRSKLSICLALSALPAIGVRWGLGVLFPDATLVGGIVLAAGIVACMAHRQFIPAAGAALLCAIGALAMTIITLAHGFEPNVLAASSLLLACITLYVAAIQESRYEWQLHVAISVMAAAFPVGTALWSVGLPTLVAWIAGAAMFLAGVGWFVRLNKQAA
jgi:hypothetical protein